MQVIKLTTRVNAEGKLILQVPQDLANQELEIVIIYQLVTLKNSDKLEAYTEAMVQEDDELLAGVELDP